MADGLAITEYSMLRSMEQISSLSHNIANANTPAYKAQRVYSETLSNLVATSERDLSDTSSVNDFSLGTIKQTGRSTDLALYSEGFFVVDVSGQTQLTRNGQFLVNGAGELTTSDGYPLIGTQGSIRVEDEFTVHTDASIWQNGQQIDRLRIVSTDTNRLESVGAGRYLPLEGLQLTETERPNVLQGALESSNVDARHELTELIKVMRQYEMQQRVIKAYDQMSDSGISTLGDFK